MNGGHILVIGYGNEMRGDDGAGRRVAEAIEALKLPGVDVVACHQLTPDLAEPIARAALVIFADAIPATPESSIRVFAPGPAAQSGFSLHAVGPSALLDLAKSVYGRSPEAWCVAIPAVRFDLGFGLTDTAQRGVDEAVATIRQRIAEAGGPPPPSR